MYQGLGRALLSDMSLSIGSMERVPLPVAATALSRDPYRSTREMLGTRITPIAVLSWHSRAGALRATAWSHSEGAANDSTQTVP